ncbi:hypothetical protein TNCV_2704861 [Trichonephila clavipes]|nr:hypothetical protein TNCV_2704861 [Trichonephila clavipes]
MVLKARPTIGILLAPCHDEFRRPRSDYAMQLKAVQGLERIDVFTFPYPYETVTVEGLQWMASSKDWRELMCLPPPIPMRQLQLKDSSG